MKDKRLTDDMRTLDSYLDQYRCCVLERNALRRRQQEIRKEFNNPLSGAKIDRHSKSESMGSASISIRLDEINTRIETQVSESEKTLLRVMDMLDFLPEHGIERLILEHKYIDRYSWGKIEDICYVSRSQAIRHWKRALSMLLDYPKVRKTIKEYQEDRKSF